MIVNPGTPNERDLRTMGDGNKVFKGDLIRIVTSGGGGWGLPFDRSAELVLGDVLDGFVSTASAERDYGVMLTPDGLAVDVAATTARRSTANPEAKMFHRREYFGSELPRFDTAD